MTSTNKLTWNEDTFSNLFDFQPKSTIKASEGKTQGKYNFYTSSARQDKFIDTYTYDGECLIFATGGSAAIHYFKGKFSTSTDCFVVKVKEKILTKLVYYFLLENFHILVNGFKGAGLKHISKKYIQTISIKYPSDRLEQSKIIELLDNIENLIKHKKKFLEIIDKLPKHIFLSTFGDPLKNPKKFKIVNLSSLFSNTKEGTKCGPFGSALKRDEYISDGIPVWHMNNIEENKFNENNCLYISNEKYIQLQAYSVSKNDILISRAGTVGRMCVIDKEIPHSIISTNLIKLSLDTNKIYPYYFTSLMTYCKGRVGRLETGSEGDYTYMNTGILKKLDIPLPPKELQEKFVNSIKVLENIKKINVKSTLQINEVFKSTLQKAFSGGLKI